MQDGGQQGKITGFRLSSRWKLDLNFQLSQIVSASTRAPVTLDQMPELYRREVMRMIEHYRNTASQGPIRKPPPPDSP